MAGANTSGCEQAYQPGSPASSWREWHNGKDIYSEFEQELEKDDTLLEILEELLEGLDDELEIDEELLDGLEDVLEMDEAELLDGLDEELDIDEELLETLDPDELLEQGGKLIVT